MKQKDVHIGRVYFAKVSNQVVAVRVDSEYPYGTRQKWYATNLSTGRRVVVSAARLRGERKAA